VQSRLIITPILGKIFHYRRLQAIPHSFWGFADQAIISASNFLLLVLLARELGPQEFGTFVVANLLLLFVTSVQNALFTQPHNVLGATRSGAEYAQYTKSTAAAQLLFAILCALCLSMVAAGAIATGHASGWMFLALSPVCLFSQLQEFIRRVLYTQSEYGAVLLNDSITYALQGLIVILLWHQGSLTAKLAILAMGIGSLGGVAAGWTQLGPWLQFRINLQVLRTVWSENWEYGRWLLGTATVYWLSTQMYPVLTAGFVGVAALGGLRAAQSLLSPMNIVLRGMESMIPSRAARLRGPGDDKALIRYVGKVMRTTGIVTFIYCAAVALVAPTLISALLGNEYQSYAWLIRFFSLYYLVLFLNTAGSVTLRSMALTAQMFVIQAIAAAFVLTLGVLAVRQLGLTGAAIGLLFNVGFVTLSMWLVIRWQLSRVAYAATVAEPSSSGSR